MSNLPSEIRIVGLAVAGEPFCALYLPEKVPDTRVALMAVILIARSVTGCGSIGDGGGRASAGSTG